MNASLVARALSAPLLLLAFLCACGGQTTTSTDGGSAAIAQACSAEGASRCRYLATCSGTYIAQEFGSEAACEASWEPDCEYRLAVPGNANNAMYTSACADAYAAATCEGPVSCEGQAGALANGASCTVADQCQTGFCDHGSGACGVCATPPTEGEACTPSLQCAGALSCNSENMCVEPSTSGQPCDATQPCEAGLRCSANPGTCVALDTTVAVGQPCGLVGGKQVACTDGSCVSGLCVAHAHVGEACDPAHGVSCSGWDVYCLGGICQTPRCP